MSLQFVGEIRMFAGNFAPAGWEFCAGQLLSIAENDALFTLIGTTYGGDGQSTFAVPDLRGRAPVHMGTGPGGMSYQIGQMGGVETVTLTTQQIPQHTHPVVASQGNADNASAAGRLLAQTPSYSPYVAMPANASMANAVTPAGGSQPHENMQPYLVMSYIIALFGIFPNPT